jgi:hypothetical protein
VGRAGLEPVETRAPKVADRREKDAKDTTRDDAKPHEVSAFADAGAAVEAALTKALAQAAEAGRFDVVGQLARELEARRLACAGNVVPLSTARRKGGGE